MSVGINYQKMVAKKYKTRHINLFESMYMRLLGEKDANEKVFKFDETSGWMSPTLYKERIAYRKFETDQWLICRSLTAQKHIQVSKLYFKIKQMTNDITNIDNEFAAIQINENELNQRFEGEEDIEASIIYQRRYREKMSGHLGSIQRKKELQQLLSDAITESSELMAEILELENIIRGICTKVRERTYERMTRYWHGILKRHPQTDKIPSLPPVIQNSDAEKKYLEEYESTHRYFDEIMRFKNKFMEMPFAG